MLTQREKTRIVELSHNLNRNVYRFSKSSNFISYKQWNLNEVKRFIRRVKEETRLENKFKSVSDEKIKAVVKTYDAQVENYFDTVKEFERRDLSL